MTTENNSGKTIRFMAPLVLGNMLNPLNSTMLATAIVEITGAFKQNLGSGALLIVPLYFTSAIGQPLMGRLADLFSAKKINILGFLLILLSAVIGIYAPSFNWLIVSRILMGLGSSAAYPSAMTMIRQRYAAMGQQVPSVALSTVAMASQVSIALGPFLGGILTESFGWQGIFAVNIPIVIIALLLSYNNNNYPESPKAKTGLDVPGLTLFSAFLMLLLLTLLYPTYLYIKLPLTILLLLACIYVELKHEQPFINVRLLAINLSLSTTFLRQIAINFILYLVLYGLPQWLEQSKKINPSRVGLMMLPMSAAAMVVSLLISKTSKYIHLLIFGTLCITAATCGLFFLNHNSPVISVMGTAVLIGTAIGLLTIANQGTLYAEAPANQTGTSFGLFRTVGYIGAIVAGSRLKHEFHNGATDQGLHQLTVYGLVACAIIILFMLPAIFKKMKRI